MRYHKPVNLPNFSFLIAGKLAGSAHPGRGERLAESLAGLREAGFTAVLTLCEEPIEPALLEEFGLAALHLPVADFCRPSSDQIERGVEFLRRSTADGACALVHCSGGFGRTGTILACYLVRMGRTADDAIEEVRRLRPGSIETPEQEEAIRQYARLLSGTASSPWPHPRA